MTPFALVNAVVQRSRQLSYGAEPLVRATVEDNVVSVAIAEIASGRVRVEDGPKGGRTTGT